MTDNPSGIETCIVCGKSAEGATSFAHIHHEGRRFALCCPMCIQMFERHRDRFARGDRPQSLLDELTREITWKNGPR